MYTRICTSIYSGPSKFFRIRLLTLDPDGIAKLVDDLEKEVGTIRQESLRLAWYMRGGLSYTEAMNLSSEERKHISNLVKENMDTTKKTKLPFF